jgi:hypothetical protein
LKGTTPAQVTGCDSADLKAVGGTGTACVTGNACASGDTLLCNTQADCPSGTCTPFRWKIIELAYCK